MANNRIGFSRVVAAGCLLVVAMSADAATLRCAAGIVMVGDSRAQVRHACGAPDDVERITGASAARLTGLSKAAARGVELWRYNFGPRNLQHGVLFVQGKVQSIKASGYGYRKE